MSACELVLCLFARVSVWFFFFTQKTAYEMRISDWSSDVCSSDLCTCCLRQHLPQATAILLCRRGGIAPQARCERCQLLRIEPRQFSRRRAKPRKRALIACLCCIEAKPKLRR